jgi:small subunit ribosomal protein S9
MADEEREGQPPAEGEDAAAEETSSTGAEAQADQGGNEEEAAAEQADAPEEPAPVEATAAPDEPEPPEPEPEPAEPEPAEPERAEPEPPEPPEPEPAADAADAAAAEEAPADEPAAEEAPAEAAGEAPAEEPRRQRPPRPDAEDEKQPEVVPGAHLEPDLVLEERQASAEGEFDPYATSDADAPVAEGEEAAAVEEAPPSATPAARRPLDLAADARYRATGKRKRAIARVILKPGEGTYTINGKDLTVYFPRVTLQQNARLPLETTGNQSRMDVVAKIHGGGVSAQAIALRHGIARALVEADPNLRGELKRHGFLTRDARVKERKKAGLKKARKRPQFSKR